MGISQHIQDQRWAHGLALFREGKINLSKTSNKKALIGAVTNIKGETWICNTAEIGHWYTALEVASHVGNWEPLIEMIITVLAEKENA